MFLSAAEAAELLGITPQRMRQLLRQGRVQGARQIHKMWVVPVFEKGYPRIYKGKRGPEPTWKEKVRRPAAANTIQINRHNLKYNKDSGTMEKTVVSAQRSGKNLAKGYSAEIHGPCKVVYSPYKPHYCGATVWIETLAGITVGGLETVVAVSSRTG